MPIRNSLNQRTLSSEYRWGVSQVRRNQPPALSIFERENPILYTPASRSPIKPMILSRLHNKKTAPEMLLIYRLFRSQERSPCRFSRISPFLSAN